MFLWIFPGKTYPVIPQLSIDFISWFFVNIPSIWSTIFGRYVLVFWSIIDKNIDCQKNMFFIILSHFMALRLLFFINIFFTFYKTLQLSNSSLRSQRWERRSLKFSREIFFSFCIVFEDILQHSVVKKHLRKCLTRLLIFSRYFSDLKKRFLLLKITRDAWNKFKRNWLQICCRIQKCKPF